MNKALLCGLLILAAHCRSTPEFSFNHDRTVRALQEKINDAGYVFYHEKNPPRIETPILLGHNFRSENEMRTGNAVYRLQIDETGRHTFRALKAPPAILENNIRAVLESLRLRPAWIGPKNYASELDVEFILEYEAH